MDVTPFSKNEASGRFFRRVDWAAFWTATVASFVVYFLTLGPSVTLEDSGELAVAGDYLGVPHPPGYPIWTLCAWAFARLFGWVTFRGQPTPAWSISLMSAVFGALASGLTAMLITRSSSDMLRDTRNTLHKAHGFREELLCWAGGVAGSLVFAFSPVMWSQATIVEVYTLNAFFLMLILLLTYRWMRAPTNRLLWMTAFVFGLGLTNYQVLLLAALPLVVVIFLRNVGMFRDFILVAIPFGLTALGLKLGAMPPVEGFGKHPPQLAEQFYPAMSLCIAGLVVYGFALLSFLVGPWVRRRVTSHRSIETWERSLSIGGLALGCLLMLLSLAAGRAGLPGQAIGAPLVAPKMYVQVATLAMAAVGLCLLGARYRSKSWHDSWSWGPLVGVGLLVFLLAGLLGGVPQAAAPSDTSIGFNWGLHIGLVVLVLLVMLGLSMTTPRGLYFALAVTVVHIAYFGLLRKGAMPGLTHPTTWWFWSAVMLNFVYLALAVVMLPHGRMVAVTILMAELGVSFYAYMPIVSDLLNPPMNWGYPRTWEGFKHALMRGQYEKIVPTEVFSPRFVQQLGGYFTDLRTQFTLLLAPLGFLPFAAWQFRRSGDRRLVRWLPLALGAVVVACALWGIDDWVTVEAISDGQANVLRTLALLLMMGGLALALAAGLRPLHSALCLFALAILFVVLGNVGFVEHWFDSSRIDKLLMAGLLLLGGAGGGILVLRQLDRVATQVLHEGNRSDKTTVLLVLTGLIVAGLGFFFKVFEALLLAVKAQRMGIPWEVMTTRWSEVVRHAGFGTTLGAVSLSVLAMAALVALYHHIKRRRRVDYAIDPIAQQWLIATVAAFLMMSVLLIALANPKGDLQDAFIQKVKFISSHGLFAIWIGYGLVFGLATFDTLLRGMFRDPHDPSNIGGKSRGWTRHVMNVALIVVVALPLIPIHQNYTNEQLIFELGGAEQNGHDFGWQFGNYQLRGAEAIHEELASDEEPLPNPAYPPAMGPDAIFFGGTDPGRFVPTYMIYSARVREDVFLITQNALADNTYMSVMRDLYGDRIWIPTPNDSAAAFQVYVDEVQSGKRPRNADLVIENGRVQVSGALGVMEINGILCRMIFDHNKARHDFYIEESYVIQWMYPYLSPHGLIMKINSQKTELDPLVVQNDLDFWDWYLRRLTRNETYRRDVVAQKSFSKLRGAIGGLYSARGMLPAAERAFQDARILYPVSPEANFRLIQEVLLRQRRYDEALDLIDLFIRADPNNDRGPSFRNYIQGIRDTEARIRALMAKVPPGQNPDVATSMELARAYRDLGNNDTATRMLLPHLERPDLSPREAYDLAMFLSELKAHAGAVKAMDRVMTNLPDNAPPELLMSAARLYAAAQQPAKMIDPLSRYLRQRPNDWQGWMDLATLYAMQNNLPNAQTALRRALELGGDEARSMVSRNPNLRSVAESMGTGGASLPNMGLGW